MMEMTPFGLVATRSESRTQLKARAKEMSGLQSALRDAPEEIEARRGQVLDLQYFVDRSNAKKMDPNDHEGLQRLIGQPEDLLTLREANAWARKQGVWRNTPDGMTWWAGKMYCTMLHPKEIAYLKQQIAWLQEIIDSVAAGAIEIEKRIAELWAEGSLPDDIAKQYHVTQRAA